MADILVARGGFADDTALLRLHHAANLSVRTVEPSLAGLDVEHIDSRRHRRPACIVFAAGRAAPGAPRCAPQIVTALSRLSDAYPDVAFVAVHDPTCCTDDVARAALSVELFDHGADEVVCLDLDPLEFAARIAAVTRRVRRPHEAIDRASAECAGRGPVVDVGRRELLGSRSKVTLTAKEATVLAALVGGDGLVSREAIAGELWTGTWRASDKAIDMHVANLRRKLRQACGDEWQIETVRGAGFVFVEGRQERQSETG